MGEFIMEMVTGLWILLKGPLLPVWGLAMGLVGDRFHHLIHVISKYIHYLK